MKAAKFPLLLTAIGTSVQARSLTFTSFDAQTLAPDDVREYANSNELNRIDFNVMIDESGDSFTCEAANIQGQEGVAAGTCEPLSSTERKLDFQLKTPIPDAYRTQLGFSSAFKEPFLLEFSFTDSVQGDKSQIEVEYPAELLKYYLDNDSPYLNYKNDKPFTVDIP